MTIHEYGVGKEKVIVLVHPSAVMWDYFTYVIQIIKKNYHLIVPALPGYDESNPHEDFTSVEEIADSLAQWLIARKIKAFSTDEYSKEDLAYLAKVIRFMSCKTIWRTFESCNNYSMPQCLPEHQGRLQYWYGDKESEDQRENVAYVKNIFPMQNLYGLRTGAMLAWQAAIPRKWPNDSNYYWRAEISRIGYRRDR